MRCQVYVQTLITLVSVCFAHPAESAPLQLTAPPRADCMSLMPGGGYGGLYDWRETLAVEHCDRLKRLWDIAAVTAHGEPPQFFEGSIPAADLPTEIRTDVPLLRVVFPERVFFDTAESELRPEAWEVVRIVARNLQLEPPDVVVFVAGHTDRRGGREYNQGLSVQRANAVADAILTLGVNVAKVWRVGFGEDMPLRAGDDEEAWGQNRRVEFLFAARAEAVAQWLADSQLDMLCQGRTAAEADDCVRQLDLNSRYVAIETSRTGLNLGVDRPGVRLDVQGTQRIHINPVNRRASAVERD